MSWRVTIPCTRAQGEAIADAFGAGKEALLECGRLGKPGLELGRRSRARSEAGGHRRLGDLCGAAEGTGDEAARLLLLERRGRGEPGFEDMTRRTALEVEDDHPTRSGGGIGRRWKRAGSR